jgi:hypothetical protein
MSSGLRVSGTFVGVYLFGNLFQIVANYFNISSALVVFAAAGLAGFAAGYQYFHCNRSVLTQLHLHFYTIPMSIFLIVTAMAQYLLQHYSAEEALIMGLLYIIPLLIGGLFITCKFMRIMFMFGLETAQKRQAVYG